MTRVAFILTLLCGAIGTGTALAATISGSASLSGDPTLAGITVEAYSEMLSVPTLGGLGVLLLLVAASWLLHRSGKIAGRTALVGSLLLAGMAGLAYASLVASTATDAQGDYNFSLAPGTYSVRLSYPGYQTSVFEPVHVGSEDVDLGAVELQLLEPTATSTPTEVPTETPTPTDTPTETPTPTPTFAVGDAYEVDPYVGTLRYIPGGTFTQGSTDPCFDSDEVPFSHTLTRDIAVMQVELSQQMWADLQVVQTSLMQHNSKLDAGFGGPNRPVQRVSWYMACLFANRLSVERGLTPAYYADASFTVPIERSNYLTAAPGYHCNFDADGFRLLTEGEWEYCAKAGVNRPFPTDVSTYNDPTCFDCTIGGHPDASPYVWYCGNNSPNNPKDVGTTLPNAWGLYDLQGNIQEWCWDWYQSSYPSGSVEDYTGSTTVDKRVFRGGAYLYDLSVARASFRNRIEPTFAGGNNLGFRLCRTVE